MDSAPAVECVFKGTDEVWPENSGEAASDVRPLDDARACARVAGLEPALSDSDVLRPAVGPVFSCNRCPTKCGREVCLSAYRSSVSATHGKLTVDWPLHLRETPVPFTSRLPGIATLGPSCTPDRQLGSWLWTRLCV